MRRRLAWLAGGLALAGAVVATPWALLRSEAGSAWLLRQVPGLELQGLQGALLGPALAADRVAWQGAAGRLELSGLRLTGVQRQWFPAPGQWLALRAEALALQSARWTSGPPGPAPKMPHSLRLPLALDLPVTLGEWTLDAQEPLRQISGHLRLGADGGAGHRLDGLAFERGPMRVRGQANLAADPPFALEAMAEADLPEMQARAEARGPLDRLVLQARLRGGGARADAAAADLQATVAPFAPWPLLALTAQTQALDLSRLDARWPQTRLSGRAELRSSARDAPFQALLDLDNRLPGRWNEGRLPLRRAEARLGAQLNQPDRVEIESLELDLADATGPAGRWSAEGRWQGTTLELRNRLQRLSPQRLDGRAATMALDGSVALAMNGLPSPDPRTAAERPVWSLALRGALEGRLDAAPVPVQLEGVAEVRDGRVALHRLRARAGAAGAEASGNAVRHNSGWAFDARGRLQDFDPVPWWPGREGSAWRRGPHRLNGDVELALTLPGDWRTLDGQARVALERSVLAGVPLQAEARLDPGRQWRAALDVGGNRLNAEGRADPAADGRDDRWRLALDAPALARLAPLAALHPALAVLPRDGRALAQAELAGRWPALSGQAQAEASGVRADHWALGRGTLALRLTGGVDAPLAATLALSDLTLQDQRITQAEATLEGTPAAHRLRADALLPAGPAPDLAGLLGWTLQRGTQLHLGAEGGLRANGGRLRWAGRLARLSGGPWNGEGPAQRPAPRDWLDLGPLAAELEWAETGGLQQLRVDAGRLALGRDITLAWNELRLDNGTWQARATVEGFRLAPMLARWQPDMGWKGDLRLGGSLDLRAGERFDADLVFERLDGDLAVDDASDASLALGLTDLRLALSAHDGTWYFTQALAGRTLGEAGGAFRVLTAPGRRWPEKGAPLDGSVAVRVANLGVWGAWVPPGWRLEGALETRAQVGGRFGAPELRGELIGSGLGVRNLLQGVQVSGGDVRVRLEGERATIERFRLGAGEGQLTVTGGAQLGASPSARLQLEAQRFRVLGRVDRRLVASGRAELELQPQLLALKGQVEVDEALFDASRADAPSLDDDVTVRRANTPAPTDATAAPARRPRAVDVSLDVGLGQKLRVRGRGLDTLLAGRLRVTAPGGRLAVNGTVNAERGTYAAYGQRLVIERGLLAFSGPADNPRLDVLALRPNLDIEVGVAITGNVQAPRVRLHSRPELSETDKLSWLVLGRDPGGLGRTDTALLQRAAVALLSGEGEAPTDTLIRNLGLDEVSVRQSDDAARETIVTVGKQLGQRWYVGYERGVNATVGTWQLIYRIAQRFTLRAQSGAENSLDLIWVRRVP